MNFPFFRKDFATVSKIERLMKSKLAQKGLEMYRNNNGTYVITTDRAEIATVCYKTYARSFDMYVYDVHGYLLMEPITYAGSKWKEFLSRRIDELLSTLNSVKVPDGYVIRHDFNQMMMVLFEDNPSYIRHSTSAKQETPNFPS